LPVVGTRKAGLPDHLGEDGIWIDEANQEQLAQQIMQLLGNERLRRLISSRLRRKASEFLSWDVIAQHTLDVYRRALARMRPRSTRLPDTSEILPSSGLPIPD
jgi:glycosyltransferase involved in cell wall biosynthesis